MEKEGKVRNVMASKERLASNPIVQKSLDIFWRLQVLSLALKHDTKEKRRTKATAASKEQRFRLAKQLLCTWSKHNQVSSHFYFILLVSPVIGRVTATAWRQLLRARNSPFPHTPGTTSPTLLRTVWGFFNLPQNSYMQGLWDGAYGFIVLIRED